MTPFFLNHLLAVLYILSLRGTKLHIMISIECLFPMDLCFMIYVNKIKHVNQINYLE